MPHKMFLPCECLGALHAVVRSLRLNAHVKLEVTVEVLPPGVGLGAALVGAVEEALLLAVVIAGAGVRVRRPVAVSVVGVEGGEHCHGDGAVSVPSPAHPAVKHAPPRYAGPV